MYMYKYKIGVNVKWLLSIAALASSVFTTNSMECASSSEEELFKTPKILTNESPLQTQENQIAMETPEAAGVTAFKAGDIKQAASLFLIWHNNTSMEDRAKSSYDTLLSAAYAFMKEGKEGRWANSTRYFEMLINSVNDTSQSECKTHKLSATIYADAASCNLMMGEFFFMSGSIYRQKAVSYFDEALLLDPHLGIDIYLKAAHAHHLLRNYEKAAEYYKFALSKGNIDNPTISSNAAACLKAASVKKQQKGDDSSSNVSSEERENENSLEKIFAAHPCDVYTLLNGRS